MSAQAGVESGLIVGQPDLNVTSTCLGLTSWPGGLACFAYDLAQYDRVTLQPHFLIEVVDRRE